MKKKRKRAKGTIRINGQVEAEVDVPIKCMDPGENCSHVRIGCGFVKSLNYNSVRVDVEVEVPVKTGYEMQGAEYATAVASAIIDDLRKPALEALESL